MTNAPTARPTVVWTKMPDGAVLFSTETEVYYSLNPIGAYIWSLLPRSVDELCAAIHEEHPAVAREEIHADVLQLLTHLEESALIEWSA